MGDEQDVTLRRFGEGEPAPASDLAELHRKLLPSSPLLLLGRRFLEDFYYGVVPEEGLAFGTVAYENGRPVAFVVATGDSNGFLATAIKRRWKSLASITVRHPPSPRAAWQALRLLASRGRDRDTEPDLGEILSLGVLPPDAGGPSSSRVRRTLSHSLVDDAERPGRHRPRRRDQRAGPSDVRRHGVDRRTDGHRGLAGPPACLPVERGTTGGLRPGRSRSGAGS
jgi:hypothetical protein